MIPAAIPRFHIGGTGHRSIVAAFIAFFLTGPIPASANAEPAANVVPLTLRTPRSGFNRMVVSLTVCEPGTDRCAVIDNVMVDTGSTGLRLENSALPPGLDLPAFSGSDGRPLAECLHFVHDQAWGPLHRVDLRIGGLTVDNLPIQLIADDLRPRPASCPASNTDPTSNGTLGVGPHLFDCQGACRQDPERPGVFVEDAGSWQPVLDPVPTESRLPNPASMFTQHGNGIVLELPATPADGTREIVGTLTFGVGTASNNHVSSANILGLDGQGLFTTRYGGADFRKSYIDSGTETYILIDDRLPRCAGMDWAFCISPSRTLEATMIGSDGRGLRVPFSVGDYRTALGRHVGAWDGFAEVGQASSEAFVWGAPFFVGRRIALVFDGRSTIDAGGVRGPFYALP